MSLTAPKLAPNQRTITRETGRRSVELPVDQRGRERLGAKFDTHDVRAAADGSTIVGFNGHAAVFDSRTWIGPKKWGFWEQCAESVFDKTISEADVRFLVEHDPMFPIARSKYKTLRLSTDDKGLVTDADMDTRVSYVSDLVVQLDRGDRDQMSFAFEVVKESWEELDNGDELRILEEVRLWDVSVVTYPAYEDTDAGLRAAGIADAMRNGTLSKDQLRELKTLLEQTETTDEPAESTRNSDDPQPAESTEIPLDIERQLRGLAALHGLSL